MEIIESDEVIQSAPPASRRDAREIALRALYALELSGNSLEYVFKDMLDAVKSDDPIYSFTRDIIGKTYDHREELDSHIRHRSNNWDFDRIAIIDKIILRIAICEFLFFFDIPPKVSIDEAIELSKLYSTEKSSSFINGILDSVLEDLKLNQQIVKTGRGRKEK
jgi:transcription antitermination protein NusB